MARTEAEIRQEIENVIAANDLTGALTQNPSATAIWRLFIGIFVRSVQTLENLWDLYKGDVKTMVESMRPGDDLWVAQKAKEYQHGYSLSIINGKPGYDEISASAQIVSQVAVSNRFGQVWVKVVKGDPTARQALADSELIGFTDYMKRVMFAGVETICISQESDKIRLKLDVYGQASVLDELRQSVPALLRSFFPSLVLDGSFQISDLEALIKQLPGCSDAVVYQVQHMWQGGYNWVDIPRKASPVSGWFEFEPGWDLDSGINIKYYQS